RAERPPGQPRTEQEQRDPWEQRDPRAPRAAGRYGGAESRGFHPLALPWPGAPRAVPDPSPRSMAQWQEVQSLANTHLERVHQLYAGSALPMAVRHCLAAWIEDQNWPQAAEPLSSHARMLFHSLLVLLGERLGSLGSGHEDFMLKHNLRKAHRELQ
ncbi:STAT2 protein, partial [Orthonyx spaldingii]|nr:STAT2 protein [Orthonyx spaldingii]